MSEMMNRALETTLILREAWREMTSKFPEAKIEEGGAVATTFANLPLFFFNMNLTVEPVGTLGEFDQSLELSLARAAGAPFGWFHALCHELTVHGWEETAAARGLMPIMQLTGMSTEKLSEPKRALPELDFRAVNDARTYEDIATVNGLAYEMPAETFGCIVNDLLWKGTIFGTVGYVDDQAMTAAAAFPVNGTIYLALVATKPGNRGKGFAEAAIRHVAKQCADATGLSRLTLHGTAAGRPLYEQMGFGVDGEFSLLMAHP